MFKVQTKKYPRCTYTVFAELYYEFALFRLPLVTYLLRNWL